MTPGQYRSHARFLRDEASDLRRMAAGTPIHHWRDKWIRDADRCEEDAEAIIHYTNEGYPNDECR